MQLTETIREKLFNEILEGRYAPGERMPTEMETGDRFQTSRVTVRRAYSALEKAGIIVRRKRYGTIVSSSYAGSTDPIRTIAAVMPLHDTFSRDFLETLCRVTARQNVLTVIDPDAESGPALSHTAIRLASAGVRNMVIWARDRSYDADLFGRLRVLGVNLVFFDRIRPSGGFADYVGLDNRAAIRALMEDAVSQGIRNFVFGDASGLDVDSNRERRAVFISECESRGMDYSFFEFPWEEPVTPGLRRTCLKFLSQAGGETSALICVNDTVAVTASDCVPENCRIYSIDGKKEALERGIITYSQPMEKMAESCFAALNVQRKKGEKWQATEYRFEGELLRR